MNSRTSSSAGHRTFDEAGSGRPNGGEPGRAYGATNGIVGGRRASAYRTGLAILVQCACCGNRLVVELPPGSPEDRGDAATYGREAQQRDAGGAAGALHLEVTASGDLIANAIASAERELSLLALEKTGHVKARAARLLGLKPTTFHTMLTRRRSSSTNGGRNGNGGPSMRLSDIDLIVAHVALDGDTIDVIIELDWGDRLLPHVRRRLRADIAAAALRRARGNLAIASRLCGMKYTTFYALVHRLRLPLESKAPALQSRRER